MTQQPGRKENQHYVPKMLLRNFSISAGAKRGQEQVHVLDKSSSRAFVANIRNIAAAFEFYEAELAGRVVNAEAMLSELEGHASAVLQKMLATETVASLNTAERMWLSIFCSVQFVRTQTARDRIEAMNKGVEEHIRRMGYDPAEVDGYRPMSEEDIKAEAIRLIARAVNEYPPLFNNKHWFLMKADGGLDFLIGDHPVVLHNDRDYGPYGNLGFAVPGIQLYMPLAPRLMLAMWCPTIFEEIDHRHREHEALRAQAGRNRAERRATRGPRGVQLRELEKKVRRTKKRFGPAQGGGEVACNDGNVTMLNSLQVRNASRFLMSQSGNFTLAERMLQDNPKFRSRAEDGLRFD
jgi:hypothetical protein